jgi:hypothetical protein
MKTALAFAVLVGAAMNCGASTGRAEDLKAQKFIMVDEPAFKDALSFVRGKRLDSVDAYGIFIDGLYAGQIGDTIRVAKQAPSSLQIVGRADGKTWTETTVLKPANGKVLGLYGLKINPQHPKNVFCTETTLTLCNDFVVEGDDKTEVLLFKPDAFADKQLVNINWSALGPTFGPSPSADTKSIIIATEPAGAEIYLDNYKFWQTTNSTLRFHSQRRAMLTLRIPSCCDLRTRLSRPAI